MPARERVLLKWLSELRASKQRCPDRVKCVSLHRLDIAARELRPYPRWRKPCLQASLRVPYLLGLADCSDRTLLSAAIVRSAEWLALRDCPRPDSFQRKSRGAIDLPALSRRRIRWR